MSMGLLTRRTDGSSMLTPGVFTVRAVETFFVGGSARSAALRIARPAVRARMFATCTPSDIYTPRNPGKTNAGMAMAQLGGAAALVPAIACYNGGVELLPPIRNGEYSRNIYVHVFEYL